MPTRQASSYTRSIPNGRFEVVDAKSGKHQREINFDGAETSGADKSGGHDLRMK
jgi:filamentous hemagglutinin